MRNRVTEDIGKGETEDIDDADEFPPLATCVRTLQEAVEVTIALGLETDFLFNFARALKAFEITTDRQLNLDDQECAFALLWAAVKAQLSEDADFDEYRFQFEEAFALAETPLGANHFHEAVVLADTQPEPPECERYPSGRIKRLIAVCHHLQTLAGARAFFLSVRLAAEALGIQNLRHASAYLNGLVRDGILSRKSKGVPGGKRASRFRYVRQAAKKSETQSS